MDVQDEIKSGAMRVVISESVEDENSTNKITATLREIFKTLDTFTKNIESNLGEVETKFGLQASAEATSAPLNPSLAAILTKEDRMNDVKLDRLAKEASKYIAEHNNKVQPKLGAAITSTGEKALVPKMKKLK